MGLSSSKLVFRLLAVMTLLQFVSIRYSFGQRVSDLMFLGFTESKARRIDVIYSSSNYGVLKNGAIFYVLKENGIESFRVEKMSSSSDSALSRNFIGGEYLAHGKSTAYVDRYLVATYMQTIGYMDSASRVQIRKFYSRHGFYVCLGTNSIIDSVQRSGNSKLLIEGFNYDFTRKEVTKPRELIRLNGFLNLSIHAGSRFNFSVVNEYLAPSTSHGWPIWRYSFFMNEFRLATALIQ